MILTCLIAVGAFAGGAVLGATASKAVSTEISKLHAEAALLVNYVSEGVEHLRTIASPPKSVVVHPAEVGVLGNVSLATPMVPVAIAKSAG